MCLFDARHDFSIFLCDVRHILRILDERLLVCARELRALLWMTGYCDFAGVHRAFKGSACAPIYGGWVMKCLYGMTVSNTVFLLLI